MAGFTSLYGQVLFHCVYTTFSVLMYSSVNGCLGRFPILVLVNDAAVNVDIQVSLQDSDFISFSYMPRNGIAE